jgi:dTDP-4-dehydrorhamnose 3,5-epimerase
MGRIHAERRSPRAVVGPPSCAHGFLATAAGTSDFHYKTTAPYSPRDERSLRWDDQTVSIRWPTAPGTAPILSVKDATAPGFHDCEKFD